MHRHEHLLISTEDVLPLRPSLKYFESLTSYILRLCRLLRIISIEGVVALFFPLQSVRVIRNLSDFPPILMLEMSQSLQISEEVMLRATFHGIGLNFGRSTHPQALSRFLSGVIGPYLRYCPQCIAETRYYSLTWRFLPVISCPKHGCMLLDSCAHCERSIPMFTTPLQVGVCPNCLNSLTIGPLIPATRSEIDASLTALEQIRFLLTPQNWEISQPIEKRQRLGIELAKRRNEGGLDIRSIATQIGVSRGMIEGIEHGNLTTRGATFLAYWKYAQYFETSLVEIYKRAMAPGYESIPNTKLNATELFANASAAIQVLSERHEEITGQAVADLVKIPRSTLICHDKIATLIRQAAANQKYENEQLLAERAAQFIADQYPDGDRCSQESLAIELSISRTTLRRSNSLMKLLRREG